MSCTGAGRCLPAQDAVMCFAMLCCLAGIGIVIESVNYGAGRHRGDIDQDDFIFGSLLNFISQPLYLWVIFFVKLAIGFSLLRIATEKFYRILIISIMTFMGVYTVGCFLVSMRNWWRCVANTTRPSRSSAPISRFNGILLSKRLVGVRKLCKH